jgi:hypothetical protein
MAIASSRAPRPCCWYSCVGLLDLGHVQLDPQTRLAWAPARSRLRSCSGSLVRRWPSCQIQWVSIAVTLPGAAAPTWVNMASDTSKWLLECEPQVRPQSRQVCATRTCPPWSRSAGRPAECPPPAAPGVGHLAPVGGDHVGGGGQAGGAAKFGHDLAAGEAVFGAAGVFGIGQDAAQVAQQAHRVLQQPAAVGIQRDAGLRKALVQRAYGLHLLFARAARRP